MQRKIRGLNGKCPTTGKIQLESEEDAAAAAKSLRKRRGPRTSPYECTYCLMWHIGHNRPPEKRRKRTPWKVWAD